MLSGVRIVSRDDAEKERRRDSKRAKKEKKAAKKAAKRRRKDAAANDGASSSSGGGSDDDAPSPRASPPAPAAAGGAARDAPAGAARDEWMSMRDMGEDAAKARDPKSSAQHAREAEAARAAKVAAERELNPHFADGGDGRPDESRERGKPALAPGAALLTPGASGGVGDGGASWRLKALRRAKERAAEEGRSLADVVGDRWGSVAQLVDSIGDGAAHARAHQRNRGAGPGGRGGACFRCGRTGHLARDCAEGPDPSRDRDGGNPPDPSGSLGERKRGRDASPTGDRSFANRSSYLDDVGSRGGARRMIRPGSRPASGPGEEGPRSGPGSRAPLGAADRRLIDDASRAANAFASDGSFMDRFEDLERTPTPADDEDRKESESFGRDPDDARPFPPPPPPPPLTRRPQPDRATAGVAAKPSGNVGAAAALRARLAGKKPPSEQKVESLPMVTADGRAAPGAFGRATTLAGGPASAEGAVRKAPRTTQRFEAAGAGAAGGEPPGQASKVRYYRDDDSKTLRDLVSETRHGGAEDDYDRNFAKNVAMQGRRYKGLATERDRENAVDDEYDNDEGLEAYENREKRMSGAKQQARAKARAVLDHRRAEANQRRCPHCLDNPEKPFKHLHVAYGNLAYLALPHAGRLVPGHCVIAPIAHGPSSRAADEDAWEEMRNFKKCLVRMFASRGKTCVFLETCSRRTTGSMGAFAAAGGRHATVECVPIPDSVAESAPMYFKKAIDEAESEWSTHDSKKCLSTAPPKGLRQTVPEGFPYFHVEFDMRGGFAHVIDDETRWRNDFGRDVLCGLLDLPPNEANAKKRPLAPAQLKREMDAFLNDWDPVDWTKQLG